VDAALIADPFAQNGACANGNAPACVPYAIDSVSIRTAEVGECPAPGTIENGTFTGATGWTLGGSASVAPGWFSANLTNLCQTAHVTQQVTLPHASQLENPALRFVASATAGETIQVQLLSDATVLELAQFIGTGAASPPATVST